jgi:hypothetical protein
MSCPTPNRRRSSLALFVPALALGGALLASTVARAADRPRADVSLEGAATRYGEFEETGVAFGARLSYRALDWLALDGGLLFAPGDLGDFAAFSGSQLEALFGLRAGPRLGGGRVYGALRSGFVRFSEAPEPIACIAIFPPPLECVIAAGHTAFAVSFGGGGELPLGARGLLRLEVGDLLLKYPGPAIANHESVLDESFWRHNLRASVSVGFRF